jgi:hypothetical protein
VGPRGRRAARLHRRLATHLPAADQPRRRLRRAVPAGYEDARASGLRLLRVPARAKHGPAAVGPLYVAFSSDIFDSLRAAELTARARGSREFAEPLLVKAGLPAELANALDDTSWDAELQAQTDPALSLTGRDVGTPIIQFQPPHGVAFFGPVISRLPGDDDALRLWDHVVGLAACPGFAELKRSLRERPQLRSFGVDPGQGGTEEDWHAASRAAGSPIADPETEQAGRELLVRPRG